MHELSVNSFFGEELFNFVSPGCSAQGNTTSMALGLLTEHLLAMRTHRTHSLASLANSQSREPAHFPMQKWAGLQD